MLTMVDGAMSAAGGDGERQGGGESEGRVLGHLPIGPGARDTQHRRWWT